MWQQRAPIVTRTDHLFYLIAQIIMFIAQIIGLDSGRILKKKNQSGLNCIPVVASFQSTRVDAHLRTI